ncbi:MAG: glycoside hydrolase family 16 protein [Bacteroidales bacterium]|nr:glycoside hydrolase family 16 protein [Bacteroidales bacterium]
MNFKLAHFVLLFSILSVSIDSYSQTQSHNVKRVEINPPFVEKLIWQDEFDGKSLDTCNWRIETNVFVNDEWQIYTDGANIVIEDGLLKITAKKIGKEHKKGEYTSGRINSSKKREFKYGRFEIRAKLPSGVGTWPAIWLLGHDIDQIGWPRCGEIDIMEHVGLDTAVIHSSLHSPSSFGMTVNTGTKKIANYDCKFHIYGVNWTFNQLDFYIDSPDNIFYSYNPNIKNDETWPFDKPFYLILNLAIGGNWGGIKGVDDSMFPQEMLVDYVRVYQYVIK